MTAAIGATVKLYVDLIAKVDIGHVIRTQTGRCYGVVSARRQSRGKHVGRQHLVVVVLDETLVSNRSKVHTIRWYKRGRGRR